VGALLPAGITSLLSLHGVGPELRVRLKSQSLRMLNPPNGLALHGARSMKTSDGNSIVAKLCEDIVRVLAG